MSSDPRLHLLPDVPAAIFVEPTAEQWFLVKHFRRLFAPRPDEEHGVHAWLSRVLVVRMANFTSFSTRYQLYQVDIFHQTSLPRVVHFICMPLVCALMLTALGPHCAWGGAVFGIWCLIRALIARLPLWGFVCLVWSGFITWMALAFRSFGVSPWPWLVLVSLVIALSHATEPLLPPRVNDTNRWVRLDVWLREPPHWLDKLRRMLRIAETFVYGVFNEAVASPRLGPIFVLELMWLLGYAPEVRREWKATSNAAITSGNAALDYIGSGGATALRAADHDADELSKPH